MTMLLPFGTVEAADVQVRWISPRGKPLDFQWPVMSEWQWKSSKKDGEVVRVPYLRTWIGLPRGLEIATTPKDVPEIVPSPPSPPILEADTWIALDTTEPSLSTTLRFRDSRDPIPTEGRITELGLLISNRSQNPEVSMDEGCADIDLKFKPFQSEKSTGYSFLGITCSKNKKSGLDFDLYYDSDAELKMSVLEKGKVEPGTLRAHYEEKVEKGKKRNKPIIIKITRPNATAYHQILFDRTKHKTWTFFTGMGITSYSYSDEQPAGNVSLNAIALTLKAGVAYHLSKRWDLGLSAFGNLLNLSSSITPSTYPAARFIGINLRAGWTLVSGPRFSFKLSPGWYYWGMFVSDSSYGIARAMGPQIFLMSQFSISKNKFMTAYLKFAPVSSSLSALSFSSRELAVGLTYPLSSNRSRYQWSISLDASQLTIGEAISDTKPSLTTISLGAGVAF